MDDYIKYLLPNEIISILESINYHDVLITFIIVFLVNIYLKVFNMNNDMLFIERNFHKKCRNIKLSVTTDKEFNNNSFSKLNETIKNFEINIDKNVKTLFFNFQLLNNKIESNNKKLIDDIVNLNNEVKNICNRLNDEDYEKIKNEISTIYLNIEEIKRELLDEIDIVRNKAEEALSNMQ
jgi:hypothetical protein